MIFDWDENKEKLNVKNHDGIDFDEASRAVQDKFALEEYDDVHSTADEKRYKCIGESQNKFCMSFLPCEMQIRKKKSTGLFQREQPNRKRRKFMSEKTSSQDISDKPREYVLETTK